jgi:hypothetical protein
MEKCGRRKECIRRRKNKKRKNKTKDIADYVAWIPALLRKSFFSEVAKLHLSRSDSIVVILGYRLCLACENCEAVGILSHVMSSHCFIPSCYCKLW